MIRAGHLEQTGQEPARRERSGREQSGREQSGQERTGRELVGRAQAMRAAFDAGFADRPQPVVLDTDDVLALRIGGEERLIRLAEIAGVIAHPLVTTLPTTQPALVGVVGNRGSVLAAYDLGTLLGIPREKPEWLVIPAQEPAVGITFGQFGGYRRIERALLGPDQMLPLAGLIRTIRNLGRAA